MNIIDVFDFSKNENKNKILPAKEKARQLEVSPLQCWVMKLNAMFAQIRFCAEYLKTRSAPKIGHLTAFVLKMISQMSSMSECTAAIFRRTGQSNCLKKFSVNQIKKKKNRIKPKISF